MKNRLFELLSVIVLLSLFCFSCGSGASENLPELSENKKAETTVNVVNSTLAAVPLKSVKKGLDSLTTTLQKKSTASITLDEVLTLATLPASGIIYETDTIIITITDVHPNDLTLTLAIEMKRFNISETPDAETMTGSLSMVTGYTEDSFCRKLSITLETDTQTRVFFNTGVVDDIDIKLSGFQIQYCLRGNAVDPAHMGGKITIDNSSLNINRLKEKIPALPKPPPIDPNASSPLKADLVFKALNSLLKNAPWGNVYSLLTVMEPFNGETFHQEEGLHIAVTSYGTEPLHITLTITMDEYQLAPEAPERFSGTLTLTGGYKIDKMYQRAFFLFKTEPASPLTMRSDTFDDVRIGFDNLKLFVGLSDMTTEPIEIEGSMTVNDTVNTSEDLIAIIPKLLEVTNGDAGQEQPADLTTRVLASVLKSTPVKTSGLILIVLNDIMETGQIMATMELKELLNYIDIDTGGIVFTSETLIIKITDISMNPAMLGLELRMKDFRFISEMDSGITGNLTISVNYSNIQDNERLLFLFNTPAESPFQLLNGSFDGSTVGFENFKYIIPITKSDEESPIIVEGKLTVNGEPINDGVLDYLYRLFLDLQEN